MKYIFVSAPQLSQISNLSDKEGGGGVAFLGRSITAKGIGKNLKITTWLQ